MKYPKITVVTPNFNQANFIEQTILSVLNQNYPNLEYIIIDGDSTDGSQKIIEKYEDALFYYESDKDNGMYHALNKGFAKATGEIFCWINSDDVLWEGSLAYVAKMFSNNATLQWLQGYPSVIDENGEVFFQRPPVNSSMHFYLKKHEKELTFIQQESTFWSKHLWNKVGGKLDESYTLAADFDLWMRFFKYEKLYCSRRQLGAFRKRQGQQSDNIEKYLCEADSSLKNNWKKLKWNYKLKLKFIKLLKLEISSKINYID